MTVVSNPDFATIERVTASIATLFPAAQVDVVDDDFEARRRLEVFQGLLNVGLGFGVLVGLTAFVVASLDRAVERRANLVALRCGGVATGTLRAAQAAQVILPLGVGTVLAVVAGKLAEQATVAGGGLVRTWTWSGPIVALLLGAAALLLAAGVTAAAIGRRIDVSLIRRE